MSRQVNPNTQTPRWDARRFREALAARDWTVRRLWDQLSRRGVPVPSYRYAVRAWRPDGAPGPSREDTRAAIAVLLEVPLHELYH